MSLNVLGFILLFLFIALMLVFLALSGRFPFSLRSIRPFESLKEAIERAVEAGERVHVSLGTGSVIGPDSAPAWAGLAMLTQIARATSMSDRPVVVTTGDGAMAILARDSLRTAYHDLGAPEHYEPTAGRMLGPTPFTYVAGLPIVLGTEHVSVHILNGSFGAEAALAADFGDRSEAFVLGGTEDIQSQALLYATAQHPLIGEEVFAGGAYLNVGRMHKASLHAQDVIRILLIIAILVGVVLATVRDLL